MAAWELLSDLGIVAEGFLERTDNSSTVYEVAPPAQLHAGPVNGILRRPGDVIIASTPTAGVWRFDAGSNRPVPLSRDWDATDLTCLASGNRDMDLDIYAGGGRASEPILWEHDFQSSGLDFTTWKRIDLTPSTGRPEINKINAMVVVDEFLVLACDNGLFYAEVPAQPGGAFIFKLAEPSMLASARWSSLALGLPSSDLRKVLIAARWHNGAAGVPVLFDGVIEPTTKVLTLSSASIGGLEGAATPFRVLVTSSNSIPTNRAAYALICGLNGTIAAILKSTRLGVSNWEVAGPPPAGSGNAIDENGAFAVCSNSPSDLVIGWQDAYFTSTDAGATWHKVATSADHIAPGIHAIGLDSAGFTTILLGGRKGLFEANQMGREHSDKRNRDFPNLQFTQGDVNKQLVGYLTATIGDDENSRIALYCRPGKHWKPMTGASQVSRGPGTFLRGGRVLTFNDNNASPPQSRQLDPYRPDGWAALWLPSSGEGSDSHQVPWAALDTPPSVSEANGKSLVAVGRATRNAINGLYLGISVPLLDAQRLVEFDSVALPTTDEISAVACGNDSAAYVATRSGTLFVFKPQIPVQGFDTFALLGTGAIHQIATEMSPYIFILRQGGELLRWDGTGDTLLNTAPENLTCIDAVESPINLVLAANSTGVFYSPNFGVTWVQLTNGLPKAPHPTWLQHVKGPGGAVWIHLFTNGWSVWRRLLNLETIRSTIRTVRLSAEMGITDDEGDRSTFQINQTSTTLGPQRSTATLSTSRKFGFAAAELTVRFVYREDDSVEVSAAVFLNNLRTGSQDPVEGPLLI